MKNKIVSVITILSILMGVVVMNFQTTYAGVDNTGAWGDNGDGTYNNPVLEADYSDPDIIRVGDDYYLITSTFQLSPGLTILHSKDLINWKIINSAVRDLNQISSAFNYTGMNKYGRGIWAPCITYNEKTKTFYIHFGTPDEGFFTVKTQDIYGEWSDVYELKKPDGTGFGKGWDDCGVLWDDDGQGYFIGTNFDGDYQSWLYKMSDDGYTLQDNGIKVHKSYDEYNPQEKAPEAYKMFKKDGMYYIYHNGVYGSDRRAWLMRSEYIYGEHTDGSAGTYDNPGKYEHCPYYIVEGFRGPCQGNIISADTPEGVKWYFWTHQGATQVDGRPDSLLPLKWEDGWAKADMVWENIPKPFPQTTVERPVTSDEFNSEKLGLQWMWNYQPNNSKWSLVERSGYIRLHAFKPLSTDTISKSGNTLLQRIYKTEGNKVITKIDISGMDNGQNAGLTHSAGATNTNIGVYKTEDKKYIRYLDSSGAKILGEQIQNDIQDIYLKSEWGIDCINTFSYSFDGVTYTPFGEKRELVGANYRGDYVGIYNFNNVSDSGYVDVDYLRYEMDVQEKPPVIMGVDNGATYTLPVNIKFSRGSAKLNGKDISNDYRLSGKGIYELVVSAAGKTQTINFNLTEDAIEAGITPPFRMNVGGGGAEYQQNQWGKDTTYRDGYWGAINGEVVNYTNGKDIIYQSERQANNLMLKFNGIEMGYYKVILHFMENEYQATGKRVFDVYMQDKACDSNIDIYAKVGYQTPLIKEYDSILIDNELTISIDATIGKSTLCGVEIVKGTTPIATPRPPLKTDEVLFGKYDKNKDTISPENFDGYNLATSDWSGGTAGLAVTSPSLVNTNCGVKPVSGNALEFGKGRISGRMFKNPVKNGSVHLSLDYAQLNGLKNISLVDSRGNEVVSVQYSNDSKNAVTCDILYINGEAIENGYINNPRTEHISVNELIVDVDENTVKYKIQFSNRESGSNKWITREQTVKVKGYIRDIAGMVLNGETSAGVGYIDNVALYSKIPKQIFDVTSSCVIPQIVEGATVVADFDVVSNAVSDENLTVYIAFYDDSGYMRKVKSLTKRIAPNQSMEFKTEDVVPKGVSKAKVFFWNGMKTIYSIN